MFKKFINKLKSKKESIKKMGNKANELKEEIFEKTGK